jgi:hypothetical protein
MEYIDRIYGKTEINDPAVLELVGYPFGGRLSALRAGKGIYQRGQFVKRVSAADGEWKKILEAESKPKTYFIKFDK